MPEHLSEQLIHVTRTPPWLLRPVKVSTLTAFGCLLFVQATSFLIHSPFPQHLCDLRDAMQCQQSPSASHSAPT